MDPLAALESDLLDTYLARTRASKALYARALQVMPGGDTRTGTFHLPYPLFIQRGQGCRVWDADGNEYLDFLNNFTSLIHGHAHPAVLEALMRQGGQSTVHGSANELQVRLAELLCGRVPSVERVRFCNSGTEATLFALRAAKAFTGRPKIMKMEGGYHGSHDQVAVATAPPYETRAVTGLSPGALSEVLLGSMNDLDATASLIRKHGDQLAAVIVEPMMGAAGAIPAQRDFLHGLREVTAERGVLLVLDEIITFRLGHGGAQEIFGVRPDLTCFGKIIGGGLPIGAFGGRADVMAMYDPTRPGTIVHSGTYNGNAAAMAAGIATLESLTRESIERLNRLGDRLRARLAAAITRHDLEALVTGLGSVMQLHFMAPPLTSARDASRADRQALELVHLALLNGGVFAASRQMYVLSTAMTDDTLTAFEREFEAALERIAAAKRRPAIASAALSSRGSDSSRSDPARGGAPRSR
jgi:glutamate-1-semialdehyde 2,1-aminomutase